MVFRFDKQTAERCIGTIRIFGRGTPLDEIRSFNHASCQCETEFEDYEEEDEMRGATVTMDIEFDMRRTRMTMVTQTRVVL